jgi:hypothetical protein
MRAILPAGLWAILTLSGVGAAAAQPNTDVVRAATRQKLHALLDTYAPAREMRWYRSKDPFGIEGFCDKDLRYTPRFEIIISITRQQTISVRVYPHWTGGYMNIDRARDPNGLMQRLLRFTDQDLFF